MLHVIEQFTDLFKVTMIIKVIRNDTTVYRMCKSILVFHIYVDLPYVCFSQTDARY